MGVAWCWVITLGRFLPFHSTSVNPLLFHFATPTSPLHSIMYGSAHPIPPRLPIATRSTTPESCYPFLVNRPLSRPHYPDRA